jgi:hypothetical protein
MLLISPIPAKISRVSLNDRADRDPGGLTSMQKVRKCAKGNPWIDPDPDFHDSLI